MMTASAMPWSKQSDEDPVRLGSHVRVAYADEVTVLFVAGMPVQRLSRSDQVGLRAELAAWESVSLITQAQVARSGLVAEATFHRDCVAYRSGGLRAMLARTVRGARGPRKLVPKVVKEIERLHAKGWKAGAIGQHLGISESRVRWLLKQKRVPPVQIPLWPQSLLDSTEGTAPQQLCCVSPLPRLEGSSGVMPSVEFLEDTPQIPSSAKLETATLESPLSESGPKPATEPEPTEATELGPNEVEAIEAAVESVDATEAVDECIGQVARQRREEWILARAGQIEEQSVLFRPVEHAPYAGVLLALSLLSVTGLIETARGTLGALKKGYYGIRSILTTLVAMALLRCKRPEQLKGFDPTALGAVLGLSRAPEMKTLRNKLKELSGIKDRVLSLMREMAKRRVTLIKEAVAFLYIDGHVRPYFGGKPLSKAHVAAMRISLPATTDYWVSDAKGDPVLVVTTEGNEAMTKALPSLLEEVRTAVGPEAKPTIVFDRGGYSPALFRRIVDESRFHFMTYRKGKYDAFPETDFSGISIRRGGRERSVRVCDRQITLTDYGSVRCVAVLRSDGKQTHVLTSRDDLSAREVLERMFSRWQQENLFKYLGESYAFDALWTYAADQADPQRTVPNPERRAMSHKLAELRRQIARHKESLGSHVVGSAAPSAQVKLSPQGQDQTLTEIAKLESQVKELLGQRKALPDRVAVGTLRDDGKVLELARAPMLLSDVIKMTAFHLESMLLTAVAPHLSRAQDEGRAFLADVMQLNGQLSPRPNHLRVTLQSPSAPRYRRALEALCQHVNSLNVTFPETSIRLEFCVAQVPDAPF
jgi:hypothetical protein